MLPILRRCDADSVDKRAPQGIGVGEYSDTEREAVVCAHPRTVSFKEDILQAFYDGIERKPDTTFGRANHTPASA